VDVRIGKAAVRKAGSFSIMTIIIKNGGNEMKSPMSGQEAEYFWCLHCEKAYSADDWDKAGEMCFYGKEWLCPGDGCDGTTKDAHPWLPGDWPREHHPEYPEVPVIGVYYPLY
jgi:hypothetical protein